MRGFASSIATSKASVVHFLDADGHPWAHALADPEPVLYFCQVCFGLLDLGERWG